MDILNTITLKEFTEGTESIIFGDIESQLSKDVNNAKQDEMTNPPILAKSRNVFVAQKIETAKAVPESQAVEPWPNDVKFFQPHDVEQILLPDNSSCLAVQAYLKMCNLPYQIEYRANAEYMSPSGKVPFIKHGAFIVTGLDDVVKFLGNRNISLTSELTQEEKADMRTYMTLITNVLLNAELYVCWKDEDTFNAVTKPRYGYVYPWPLNWIQTNSKRAKTLRWLKIISWTNKTLNEVYKEVENCCIALTERLNGKKYFFSHGPTELDALLYGHLYTIITTPLLNNDLANIFYKHLELLNLVQRIEKKYFKRDGKHNDD